MELKAKRFGDIVNYIKDKASLKKTIHLSRATGMHMATLTKATRYLESDKPVQRVSVNLITIMRLVGPFGIKIALIPPGSRIDGDAVILENDHYDESGTLDPKDWYEARISDL